MDAVSISKAVFDATTMDDFSIVRSIVEEFEGSNLRKWMQIGDRYYRGDNDIRYRKMYKYVDGQKAEDTEKINNRIAHPFMKLVVDEKCGYLLGNAPSYAAGDSGFVDQLNELLGQTFNNLLMDTGTKSSNSGIGWMHPYLDVVDGKNVLRFMKVPAEQAIPLWVDEDHTELEGLIRTYFVTEYEGTVPKQVRKVEVWSKLTVQYLVSYDGSEYVLDIGRNPTGYPVGHYSDSAGRMFGWGSVPFIPFKNNSEELPDVYFVKWIIDEYDKAVSDQSNLLEEIQELIYVLKNYGGTDLAEFMSDLKFFKAIKVDDDGGVETLKADLNPDATEAHLDRLKSDFYQFSQSVDMSKDSGFGSEPSGVALEFLYSGVKLKAGAMERKFAEAFEKVFWFVAKFLEITGGGTYDPTTAEVTFTASAITNVKESLEAVNAASTTHSKRTILEHSPWVDDVDEEFKRLAADSSELEEDMRKMRESGKTMPVKDSDDDDDEPDDESTEE